MSRKNPLLLEGESMTWFCRFVRLSVEVLVNVAQLVVVKSRFCCNTKFVEGMIQERTRLLLEDARFRCGDGTDFKVQIPPMATKLLASATSLFPSADEATQTQFVIGTLFDNQVPPELVEV